MANSSAIVNGQPFNPPVLWSPERQDIWLRMRTENHPMMVQLFADMPVNAYLANGERELIAYHITGDEAYATTAFNRNFNDGFADPGTNRNLTREYFLGRMWAYYWLYEWMSDPQRDTARAYLLSWANSPSGYISMNTSDSDQNTGILPCLALLDYEFGTNYLTLLAQSSMKIGNGSAVPGDANYFSSRLTPTGANSASVVNEIFAYYSVLGAGGCWPVGSEYNIGEFVLFTIAWNMLNDRLGANYWTGGAEFIASARTAVAHQQTPDFNLPYQWNEDQNARLRQNFKRHIQFVAAGANDESESTIIARGGSQGDIYPRYFLFCNPYDPTSTERSFNHYVSGQRILTCKSATSLFGTRIAPDTLYVDHRKPDFMSWQVYKNGEWAIGHPILYGYACMCINGYMAAGIGAQQNRTYVGHWEGDDWGFIRGRTDGIYANDGGGTINTPAYSTHTSDVGFIGPTDATVIRNVYTTLDPRGLANFRNYVSTHNWASIVLNDVTPTATEFIVSRTSGGLTMPFSAGLKYAVEVTSGALVGQIAWTTAKVLYEDNSAIPAANKYALTIVPGQLTGTLAVGDTLILRGGQNGTSWDQIVLSPSLNQLQIHCRAVPVVSGSNDEVYSYTTPLGQHVRYVRLRPTTVDRVQIIDNTQASWPDGTTTTKGLVSSQEAPNEEAYWPRRISVQVDAEGSGEYLHVATIAADAGSHPSVVNVAGVGCVVGNKLVIFGTESDTVIDATSPILYSGTIDDTGTTLTCTFDAAIRGLSGGNPTPPTLSFDGGGVTASYTSGNTTSTIVFTLSRVIEEWEVGTQSYAADSFELVSDGVNNVLISARPIDNQSEQDSTIPAVTLAVISADGTTYEETFNEEVLPGGTGTLGQTLTASGGTVTLTYSSGSGTNKLVWSLSRIIVLNETVTRSYTPGTITDVVGNALVAFTDQPVTNNSNINPSEALAPTVIAYYTGEDLTPTGTITVDVTGAEVGNLLIAILEIDTTTVATKPDEFTFKVTANASAIRMAIYERVVESGDPTSYSWTTTGANRTSRIQVLRVINYDVATPRVYEILGISTGMSHNAPSITPTVGNSRLIRTLAIRTGNVLVVTPPALHDLIYVHRTTGTAASPSGWGYKSSQVEAIATGTKTFTFSSSVAAIHGAVAIAPFRDIVPPEVTSASIDVTGISFDVTFDEAVRGLSGLPPIGFVVSGHTLGYESNVTASSMRFFISPRVETGESLTYTYTQAAGNIVDTTDNELADIAATAVTNNSTYPIGVTLTIPSAGNTVTIVADRDVTGWDIADWLIQTDSATALSLVAILSVTSTSITFSLSRVVLATESITLTASAAYAVDEDGVDTDALLLEQVTNNSTQTSDAFGYVRLTSSNVRMMLRIPT